MAETLILPLPRKRQPLIVTRGKMRVATISSGSVNRSDDWERFLFFHKIPVKVLNKALKFIIILQLLSKEFFFER